MFSLIIFLPLLSSVYAGFLGYKIGTKGVAFVTFSSLFGSAFLSLYCFLNIGLSSSPLYIELFS
jgi:NADH:ubiquinone oxidoreductase subunit 5 (subunit L)/multisubunit Na+/H+ antiporter MnhA subunit